MEPGRGIAWSGSFSVGYLIDLSGLITLHISFGLFNNFQPIWMMAEYSFANRKTIWTRLWRYDQALRKWQGEFRNFGPARCKTSHTWFLMISHDFSWFLMISIWFTPHKHPNYQRPLFHHLSWKAQAFSTSFQFTRNISTETIIWIIIIWKKCKHIPLNAVFPEVNLRKPWGKHLMDKWNRTL